MAVSADEALRIAAAIDAVARTAGTSRFEACLDGVPGELTVNHGHSALGLLRGERVLHVIGDSDALAELAAALRTCMCSLGEQIDGYHVHVEHWDGDLAHGPAGDVTVCVADPAGTRSSPGRGRSSDELHADPT